MKKVKWSIKQLYERKLKHELNTWMKRDEELNGAEHGQRSLKEEAKVYIYASRQGQILREEDEDDDEKLDDNS